LSSKIVLQYLKLKKIEFDFGLFTHLIDIIVSIERKK